MKKAQCVLTDDQKLIVDDNVRKFNYPSLSSYMRDAIINGKVKKQKVIKAKKASK